MEVWKDIEGFEDFYQVSSKGRIRSKDRYVPNSKKSTRFVKGQMINQRIQNAGYKYVILNYLRSRKTILVHRLVAKTFVKGYQDGFTVNHINGEKLDNRADNLEWLSMKDNIRHGFKNGFYDVVKNKKGEKHHSAKHTNEQILAFKSDLRDNPNDTLVNLSKKHGINIHVCSSIKNGKAWSHLKI